MVKVRIDWNKGALEEIRRLPAVKAQLKQSADRIAAGCEASAREKGGYLAVEGEGRNRSRAAVVTTSPYAIGHNAKHNTILRNANLGRLE